MLALFSQPLSAEIRNEINVVFPMAKRNHFLRIRIFSSDEVHNQSVMIDPESFRKSSRPKYRLS